LAKNSFSLWESSKQQLALDGMRASRLGANPQYSSSMHHPHPTLSQRERGRNRNLLVKILNFKMSSYSGRKNIAARPLEIGR